jgi:hypothetical protein
VTGSPYIDTCIAESPRHGYEEDREEGEDKTNNPSLVSVYSYVVEMAWFIGLFEQHTQSLGPRRLDGSPYKIARNRRQSWAKAAWQLFHVQRRSRQEFAHLLSWLFVEERGRVPFQMLWNEEETNKITSLAQVSWYWEQMVEAMNNPGKDWEDMVEPKSSGAFGKNSITELELDMKDREDYPVWSSIPSEEYRDEERVVDVDRNADYPVWGASEQ